MRISITVLLILISLMCFSQRRDGSSTEQYSKNSSSVRVPTTGASGQLMKFQRNMGTGIILNIVGTGIMMYGFSQDPETIGEADNQQTTFLIGAGVNIVGLLFEVVSLMNVRRAAIQIEEKKFAVLLNENGVGVRLAIR